MNKIKPKVTVLMTVFNAEAFLEKTVVSVLDQTYKDFQFLIIDDCSTDRSVQILKSFEDPRITIHCNSRNLGQTPSLNVGLQLASAEIIARLDADDVALKDWLQSQMCFVERNKNYSVVSCNAAVIDTSGHVRKLLSSPAEMPQIVVDSLTDSPINHVGSVLKKSSALALGGYREDYKISSDFDLWSRMIETGYALTTNHDILVAIRVHESSISLRERLGANFHETLEVMKKNATRFTDGQINPGSFPLIAHAIYDVGKLDCQQIYQALDYLNALYEQIMPKYKTESVIKDSIRHQSLRIVINRLFICGQKREWKLSLQLCKEYLERYGAMTVVTCIYPFLFLGPWILRILLEFYNFKLSWQARRRAGFVRI